MSGPQRIALDVHAHLAPIFTDALTSIAGVTWNADDKSLVIDGHAVGMKPLFDPDALVAWMDRNNVEKAWISIPPPLYRSHLQSNDARVWTIYLNDGIKKIADQHPEHFAPLIHLPLGAPDIAADVARDWIARGHVRFNAPSGGHGKLVLSDPVFDPLWTVLNEAKAFVFFHPGECADGRLTAFYLSNLLGNPYESAVAIGHLVFGGVIERYPGITFCFAHGGGVAPMLAGRFQQGFASKRPGIDPGKKSPRDLLRTICADCITHDDVALTLAEDVFGTSNIVFGSDWPFPMGLTEPHRQMEKTEPQRRQRIFCDNPDRLTKETSR